MGSLITACLLQTCRVLIELTLCDICMVLHLSGRFQAGLVKQRVRDTNENISVGRRRCCASLQAFLKPACYCDTSVLRVLSGQNVDAVQLHTVMRAALLGCGYPASSLRATC